jgi:hypothetical protein
MTRKPTLAEAKAEFDAADASNATAQEKLERVRTVAQAAYRRLNAARGALKDAREREARNSVARDRRKAQALAAQYGIGIEIDRVASDNTHYWVTGPEAVYPNDEGDPWEGDHIGGDWSEVLHRVQVYVEDLLKKGVTAAA